MKSEGLFVLVDFVEEVFGEDYYWSIGGADVFQDLYKSIGTILLMGYWVMLKMASSLREFLLYFYKK